MGHPIAIVRLGALSGRQTVDGATIMFKCEIENRAPEQEVLEINDATGRVDLQRRGDLGPCWLLSSFRARPGERSEFFMCINLSDEQIRKIDRERAGRPNQQVEFSLWLRIRGQGRASLDTTCVLNVTASASEWFSALAAAQYEARHIIDVPIAGGRVGELLATAATHYRLAIEQDQKASYTQVLVECRKTVEAIRDALDLHPKGIAEFDATKRKAWSNAEAIEYARASIHQIMHHAAHPGVDDITGPIEAELVLGLVGSLLRYYASGGARR
ncbi:MAG: hypothetical protein QM831_43885 [Kofleriaceae bacterium]